ncbi:hypothetical protein CL653_03140 [bacterium]|nr:hypothetical protein [bacterium]|tara:strand:- start:144 stop:1646 length:1503 start_codon:yes stop_codon:yes gene_type:complete
MFNRQQILQLLAKYKWWLPPLSAVLLILAVPPFSFNYLALVGWVPMFLFTYLERGVGNVVLGWFFSVLLNVGYITVAVFSGFQWIEDANLFLMFVQVSACLAVVAVVSVFVIYALILAKLKSVFLGRLEVPFLLCAFLGVVVIESLFSYLYGGFNYGALFFAVGGVDYLRSLVSFGGSGAISVTVVLINIFIFLVLLKIFACPMWPRFRWYFLLFVVFVVGIFLFQFKVTEQLSNFKYIDTRVAIIQNQDRQDDVAFGQVQEGSFTFPKLETLIEEAEKENPDIIVYPFAPWNGVISETLDNSRFDREVITMTYDIFSDWLMQNISPEAVFVAWYTSYEDGNYYNQIGYWHDGELIHVYTKEKLFPFFDYVPTWALDLGIVSLPFDGTAGTENTAFNHGDLHIGSLVCSEVGDEGATNKSAEGNNIIFSLGSETMFNHEIPGEYNVLRAQLSATKHQVPVIRANRFGPSAVFDSGGHLLDKIDFGVEGVMVVDVPVPRGI